MEKFLYSVDNKRYHTLHYYNLRHFGGKVFKASLDAGLSCPNRRAGGCIYCRENSRYFTAPGCISEQMERELERIHRKNPEAQVIAYFQAGTNTLAPVTLLRNLWDEALSFPGVVGMSIATRADCLGEDVLTLLEEFRDRTELTVELGLQTVHDGTARAIGRGHDYETFLRGYRALKERGIRVCVHIINGLPGETEEMMMETARKLGGLRPDGVKIHLLHVSEGTPLAELWEKGNYSPMEKENYVNLTVRQLQWFPPETVMERLTGDGDRRYLLAPLWSRDKIAVLGAMDKAMADLHIFQGDCFDPLGHSD